MDATRSRAYGRLARTLELAYPDLITDDQLRRLRQTADTLIFARYPGAIATLDARDAARNVLFEMLEASVPPWWIEEIELAIQEIAPPAVEREPAPSTWRQRLSAGLLR